MKKLFCLVMLLLGAASPALAQLASPFSNSVWPAQSFTASAQTGTTIQLNALTVPSTVGSSFASGTLTLTGTSLTTVTFSVMGSSDNGNNFYALPIYTQASPTTSPSTSVTATGNGLYQVSLAGMTHLRIVTSGTFTATSVSFVLSASPNVGIAKSGGSGSAPSGSGNLAYMTPDGSSGAASLRAILPSDLPKATTSAAGIVQPDGTSCNIVGGKLSCSGGGGSGGADVYLSCASELGAQVNTAVTGLAGAGGRIVFPKCTTATWTTAALGLPPNISIIGYGQRASKITCSVAGTCLSIHEPVDWASTSLSIGSEIAGFTMLGSATTASNQVLIAGEGLNGFTIHDVALNGTDLTHMPTCMLFHNTTADATFTERNTTYNFQFGQECATSVHFVQDAGDPYNSWAYNDFSFSVAPTGPAYGVVFNGNGLLYGGSLHIYGNYVGTGGGILQFNDTTTTGQPGGLPTPAERLFIAVENNSNDTTSHIVQATGTNLLNFSGDIFNGSPGTFGWANPLSISGTSSFYLSGPQGSQGLPSGVLATDIHFGTVSGSSVRGEMCPNVTGSCQIFVGRDTNAGDQATLGFSFVGSNSASNRGYLGTFNGTGQTLTWDPLGNVYVPGGAFTVGGPSFTPSGNIASFIGAWAYGTNFVLKNTSSGGNEWDEISAGSGSGANAGCFAFSNTTSWPFLLCDDNTNVPYVATLSNGEFGWSTTTTGGISDRNQNAGLSSSGAGIINMDSTTKGDHSAQVRMGTAKTNVYTVATLPSAGGFPAGTMVTVSDATTYTPGTCTGGGSDYMLAITNGSTWSCH